jgi:hypothetical protein
MFCSASAPVIIVGFSLRIWTDKGLKPGLQNLERKAAKEEQAKMKK